MSVINTNTESPMSSQQAALSVDFEYFTHLPAYRSARGTTDLPEIGLDGVTALLNAFRRADATATFFTVGEIAERNPSVCGRITDAGHEIGSHTYTHQHLSELSLSERHKEVEMAKARLEAVTGTNVVGFRAPSFDMGPEHFEMLTNAGYEYDTSVVPCRSIPGWYGGEFETDQPSHAQEIDPDAPEDITEIPVSVMPGLRLPLTGTWLRLFGVNYTIFGMRLLARRGITPVLYIHPWELVNLPPVEDVPRRVYARTGDYMRRAVRKILSEPFEFVTVGELAAQVTPAEGESA